MPSPAHDAASPFHHPSAPDLARRRFGVLLASSVVAPSLVRAADEPAPALLLAREAPPDPDPAGWLVSEKLDGVRALWDGTRLRLRGGGTVAAPSWFTAALPARALDGELWIGREHFDRVSGLVRRRVPDDAAWREVRFMVFELPGAPGTFARRAAELQSIAAAVGGPLAALPQVRLPDRASLRRALDDVVADGGEGLMLHRADAPYLTGRQDVLLKLKPLHDAEAVVLAHRPGRGRHEGRMGALHVRTPEGIEFEIGTGFTDAQRDAPPQPGTVITYLHRGRTPQGVPRFASFLRVRELP